MAYCCRYHRCMHCVPFASLQLKLLQVQYLNYLSEDVKLLVHGFLAVLACVMEQ